MGHSKFTLLPFYSVYIYISDHKDKLCQLNNKDSCY